MVIKRSFCLLVSILILSCINCSCQNPVKGERHEIAGTNNDDTPALKYTTGIRSILEDSKGNIWFGSHQEGVCLFDGNKFTYFTKEDGLSDNQVRSIYEDTDGNVWFECGAGICYFDGNKIIIPSEKHYNIIESWSLDKNDLWFKGDETVGYNSTEGAPGVYRYHNGRLTYHTFPVVRKSGEENFYSVSTPFVKSSSGYVWFGTYGAAIGYNGKEFIILDDKKLGVKKETGYLHIRSIIEDSKGNLWIGNNGIGAIKYDGENAVNITELHKLGKKQTAGNSLSRIFSIGEDNAGNIWFGTVESGVWRYDGRTIINFSKNEGMVSDQIWTIYKTKTGELWFGCSGPSGVNRFNGDSFERVF